MTEIEQKPPAQTEPLFRFVAFGLSNTLRWSPLSRLKTRDLQAFPRLIHIGGDADHLLKNITDLRLSVGPLPITSMILMSTFYGNWFFGGITRPFTPDRPWLWWWLFLCSVLWLTRVGSTRMIQVTFEDDSGQEQLAYLLSLNDSATQRDPAIKEFLHELQVVVLGDSPCRDEPEEEPATTPRIVEPGHTHLERSESSLIHPSQIEILPNAQSHL